MVEKQGRSGQRGRSRARRNAAGFSFLGILALGGFVAAMETNEAPGPIGGAPTIPSATSDITITWLGDIILGDGAQPLIDQFGVDWPAALMPPPDPATVVVANLEGPLTELTEPFDPMSEWSYHSLPEVAEELANMGIDAVSLANNHAMDRGPQGLNDTITNADEAGLAVFGAGPTSSVARLPLIVESGSTNLAIAGFSDDGGLVSATDERAGIRRLSAENLQYDAEAARRGGADRIVAFVHWGGNYAAIDERQREWAALFADAGYDLVVGAGPHIVQPIELVEGMPVIFSLGNYVFGTPGRFNGDAAGFGLVAETTFAADNQLDLVVRCVQTDNDEVEYQARPCTLEQSNKVLEAINPSLVVDGGVGTMSLDLDASAE